MHGMQIQKFHHHSILTILIFLHIITCYMLAKERKKKQVFENAKIYINLKISKPDSASFEIILTIKIQLHSCFLIKIELKFLI